MSDKRPLLISRNFVVFPHTETTLEIGRDKSIASIEYAIKHFNSEAILVSQKKYEIDEPTGDDIFSVGTLVKVQLIKKNKDDSLFVSVRGIRRVSIFNGRVDVMESEAEIGKSWFSNFEELKEKNTGFLKNKKLLENLFLHFEQLFNTDALEYREIKKLFNEEEPDVSVIVDKLTGLWPSSEPDSLTLKQTWLEELDVSKRIESILTTDYLSELVKEEINNSITRKVNKNISRQQREFYLRERMKVIKEELGEAASKETEIAKVKKWLKITKAPKNIKDKVKEELNRLEYSSTMSNEAMVTKTYIDLIMSLPWNVFGKDATNIQEIKETLNKNHYGLEKIKERIIEFIAVQKRTNNPSGTIICLVGPPGVGKTSLAQSIAEALGKTYVKLALGGVNDEAEIRGHRKTYVGAMPGKIIKSLKQAKVNNPLLLLDEIDKVGSSYHGDPVSALLEVLDPKQNHQFNDNYVEESVDLSKIMFVATANYEENIPDPLLDRLELIHLTSYTEIEKKFIAIKNLIPEVLKEHNLSEKELSFTEEAVVFIIQKYTREAGVRMLKQQLSKIARKFVKEQDEKTIKHKLIDIVEVKKYLSKEIYNFTAKDEVSIPGIVNGMAYTEFGGDLLPIEINFYPGKGNISLTGNLKETMKESANVALSFIKANEKAFKLKNINWSDIDINLHVPSGGIPKDGPSAGITITTALLSAFLKVPIPCNVAMTGEITLRGKVLPIGGLKEKIISAVRGGVDVIFYPKECERYLEDVPQEILEKIQLHPIQHYLEIYEKLFINK